ncbi:glycosyltransferase family 2 protein [Oryzobacter terrae]|uniref:glycosyltransferase family 2 protein n=1 Tax=Oryzobacter terrae TaxID=1620385 RepID=UPI0036723A98
MTDTGVTDLPPAEAISVVVPTVDRPDELARCLDALVAGTAAPAEVWVVDQGGSPGTEAVLRERAAVLPLRHLVSQERGLSRARNTGLAQVSTPWVAFVDDDCVPDVDWLANAGSRLARGDVQGVTGRVLPLGEATPGSHTLSLRVSETPRVFRGRALPWLVGTGGNMVLHAPTLRRVGGYDERLGAGTPGLAGEDLEVVHRLLRAGAALGYDPAVLVRHDRVDAARRLATRHGYGFGLGAYVGVWWPTDRWVAVVLGRWAWAQVRAGAGALRHRDRWRLREAWLLLRGMAAGLRFGRRLGPPVTMVEASPTATTATTASGGDLGVEVEERPGGA